MLAVPKNMKLLAIPLFELYDNAARYVLVPRACLHFSACTDFSAAMALNSLPYRTFSLGKLFDRYLRGAHFNYFALCQVQLHLPVRFFTRRTKVYVFLGS